MKGEYDRFSRGGVFHAHTSAPDDAEPLPARNGGHFWPYTVLMTWGTPDGITWEFQQAVVTGQQGQFPVSRTYYLDKGNAPVWLPYLVKENAPGATG